MRALLFKCAVCMHGGHQSCFQNYYSRKPLVEVTVTQLPSQPPQATPRPSPRGRPSSRSGDTEWLEDVGPKDDEATGTRIVKSSSPILGHPCAAGCGHFCWATNEDFLPHVED